ncbi:hypothetical protein os1_45890 [Comamonadaceae bacterium OS-1]|nr:hypothetical protein os1_45890 [Comamonadaceae bacterium OS-1]
MPYIHTLEDLQALFGTVAEASVRKEVPTLHPAYQAWIAQSPFAVLATRGPDGLDTSPRGDPAPLVRMPDERTLLLPERRGNNRIDSLRNILYDPQVALIFFVPGVRETVRVNGSAQISADPALLEPFAVQGQLPKCVIEITVQTVFFQCARALLRSSLWSQDPAAGRAAVPTAGQMLAALTGNGIDGESYDRELPERQAKSLY